MQAIVHSAQAAFSAAAAQHAFVGSRMLAGRLLAACGVATLAAAGAAAHAVAPASITAIDMERDCFGCASASRLVLRRDGTATYTLAGKARHGTQDRVVQGRMDTAAFDELARLAVARGFFAMQDSYDNAQVQDGAWVTFRIERGSQVKSVFRREGAGPAALRELEDGIEAARLRAGFAAEPR